MGSDIQKGTTYAEGGVGGAGTVSAANLNAHVDESRIKATFISSKTLKDPASLSDSLVVENSGVLYRQTHQQIINLINTTIQGLLPVGAIIDFAGTSAPVGWLLCYGQAVSRTTYDVLFGIIGLTYGAGDSVSTFNLPDFRGRVCAGKDNMGGTAASRITTAVAGFDGTVLGAAGGGQSHQLTVAQLPAHTHNIQTPISGTTYAFGGNWATNSLASGSTGGDQAHPNVQPTVIVNKIIRYQ